MPEEPATTPIIINLPADRVERLLRAMEAPACMDMAQCLLDEYRKRVEAAFARYCPDRHYTGSPLDLDQIFAVVDVRLDKLKGLASLPRRRASDLLEPQVEAQGL